MEFVNGKDHPIDEMEKMFQTTNQITLIWFMIHNILTTSSNYINYMVFMGSKPTNTHGRIHSDFIETMAISQWEYHGNLRENFKREYQP
jgi:hypothetical protein